MADKETLTEQTQHDISLEDLDFIENKILEVYKIGVEDSKALIEGALNHNDVDTDTDFDLIDRNDLIEEINKLLLRKQKNFK